MIGFAVVPFGPVGRRTRSSNFQIAPNVDIGILYIFADRQPGGLRRHPGRLGVEQQVRIHRRAALERPAHQLRDPAGAVDPGHGPDRRLARPERDHQLAGPPRLGRSFVSAARLPALPGQRLRRDQPAAVRPARVRAGAGRRLSHRVFGDEVRHVLPRRIPARDHRQLPDGDPLLRRLGPSVRPRPGPDRAVSSALVKVRGARCSRSR